MNHKEKMNWLKENDPITYYELTSNPTGSNSSDCSIFILIGILILLTVIFSII
jgi:hypothetical protein